MKFDQTWANETEKLWNRGEKGAVETRCLSALGESQENFLAHYILGKLYVENNRTDDGIKHLSLALNRSINDVDILTLLGKGYLIKQDWHTAAKYLSQVQSLKPNAYEPLYLLGIAYQNSNNMELAIRHYLSAIELKNDFPIAHKNLAKCYVSKGKHYEAIQHFERAKKLGVGGESFELVLYKLYISEKMYDSAQAIAEQNAILKEDENLIKLVITAIETLRCFPNHDNALQDSLNRYISYANYTTSLSQANVPTEFLKTICIALQKVYDKSSPRHLWQLAVLSSNIGDLIGFERCLKSITSIDNSDFILTELGIFYFNRKEYITAEKYLTRAIEANPNNFNALNAMGGIYFTGRKVCNCNTAADYFSRASVLNPNDSTIHQNLGLAYLRTSRPELAIDALKKSLVLDPDNAEAHNNLSLALLSAGHIREGWIEHEWRLKIRTHKRRAFTFPQWQGEDLTNKTLFLHAEQGIGDEILFASCLTDVEKLQGKFIVECDKRLIKLFSRSFPTMLFVPRNDITLQHDWNDIGVPDYHAPLGSLPIFFRNSIEDFSETCRYLHADSQRVDFWRKQFKKTGPRKKVGFSWRSGSTGFGRPGYVSLGDWKQLFQFTDNIDFINLQYDDISQENDDLEKRSGFRLSVIDGVDIRNNIDELAALISALDLIITVGNINAPLAGALGKPIWRLNSKRGNDPMRLGADNYPWHPSTTLLNQVFPNERTLFSALGHWLRNFRPFISRNHELFDQLKSGLISQANVQLHKNEQISVKAELCPIMEKILNPNPDTYDYDKNTYEFEKSSIWNRMISLDSSIENHVPTGLIADFIYNFFRHAPILNNNLEMMDRIEKSTTSNCVSPDILFALYETLPAIARDGNKEFTEFASKTLLKRTINDRQSTNYIIDRLYDAGSLQIALEVSEGHTFSQSPLTQKKWNGEIRIDDDLVLDIRHYWENAFLWSPVLRFLNTLESHITIIAPSGTIETLKGLYSNINFVSTLESSSPVDKLYHATLERFILHLIRSNHITIEQPVKRFFLFEDSEIKFKNKLPRIGFYTRNPQYLSKAYTSDIPDYNFFHLDNLLEDIFDFDSKEFDRHTHIISENLSAIIHCIEGFDLFITDTFLGYISSSMGIMTILYSDAPSPYPQVFPQNGGIRWNNFLKLETRIPNIEKLIKELSFRKNKQ
ncbi:MAG: tetratricopeptide repeat protein [Gammaproteobacteria bacterium]|nr:tetratricopeptide repeat protein [Gammaproteobacteria bacterium]